jgi:cytochrome c-type biogenesis protein CcmF
VSVRLAAFKDGKLLRRVLTPGQRFYPNQQTPFASVDTLYQWNGDLYAILSAFERDGSSATIKLQVHPMISWIWLGGMVILLGVLVAVLPKRRLGLLAMQSPAPGTRSVVAR